MTFLNPMLLVLSLLAFPLVLLHSRREQLRQIPSLEIWRRVGASVASSRPSLSLPRLNLLLVLQLAALAGLVLALAQPVVSSAPLLEHQIVVLDASASMGAVDGEMTRFDDGLAALPQVLAARPVSEKTRYSLVIAGAVPELVAARWQVGQEALLTVARQAQPQDGIADWEAVARLVQMTRRDGERAELLFVTDGEDAEAATALSELEGLTFVPLQVGGSVPNAGLTARLEPVADKPGHFLLSGRVGLSGPKQTELGIFFQGAETSLPLRLATIPIRGQPNPRESSPFEEEVTLPGPGILYAQLPEDGLSSDNVSRFVLPEDTTFDVLLIGEVSPDVAGVIGAMRNAKLYQSLVVPDDVAAFELVIVDDVAVNRQPETNVLWIGRAHIAGEPEPALVAPGEVTDWRSDHPLSRGIFWPALSVSRAALREAPLDGTVLVASGGLPLAMAESNAFGRQLRLAFDPADSNWQGEAGFSLLAANFVSWLGSAAEGPVALSCEVGAACRVDARLDGVQKALIERGLPGGGGTAGAEVEVAVQAGEFIPEQVGLYRFTTPRGERVIAVNLSAGESMLNEAPVASDAQASMPALHLWPWLLALVAALLCLEAGLAWRRRGLGRSGLLLRGLCLLLLAAALFRLPLPSIEQQEKLVVVASNPAPIVAPAGAALVAIGSAVRPQRDFDGSPDEHIDTDAPFGRLEDGVQLASAMLPADRPGRILAHLPDGAAAETLSQSTRQGVALDILPQTPRAGPEVAMLRLEGPPSVIPGDSFPLMGTISSTEATEVELVMLADGREISTQTLDLIQGSNSIHIPIAEARDREVRYEAQIRVTADGNADNNRAVTWVTARTRPKVLILSRDRIAAQALSDTLAASQFQTEMRGPTASPWLVQDMLAYDAIVLMDVPAISLNTNQQQVIEKAVAEHGRPLLLLGGPNAFGPGGYLETALDRLSPLSSRVPKPAPDAAVAFVLDRSGSMAQPVGDLTKLDIARQAAYAAIGLLNPLSKVSIVAFDVVPRIILPLHPVAEKTGIAQALNSLSAGGGTALGPGLLQAFEQIEGVDAPVKHIVAMTDGLTRPEDLSDLISRMQASNITLSTIAIGGGANTRVLRDLAMAGGGAFHATSDFQALPSILSQETLLLSGSATEERTVQPLWTATPAGLFDGMPHSMPTLHGYVLTTPKPEADIHLVTTGSDGEDVPLLASWRFGSGKVLALTTDVNGPWSREWTGSATASLLWSQALRHMLPGTPGRGITLDLGRRGDDLLVRATLLDRAGEPIMASPVVGSVSFYEGAPDAEGGVRHVIKPIRLVETEPGRYEASFRMERQGDYSVQVTAGDETAQASFHLAYPQRMAVEPLVGSDIEIAQAAGAGQDQSLGLFWHRDWLAWVIAALALFAIELVARYRPRLVRLPGQVAR